MQWFRFCALSVAVCVLLVCLAAAQTPVNPPDPVKQSAEPSPSAAPNPAQPQATPAGQVAAASAGPLPKLLIGPGDEGDVSVYGVADLSQHVRVSSDGDISLPLVGKITIAGLSADEAQALIEQKLMEGGFLRSPHVTLTIKEYTSQGITVLGEVLHPGTYSPMGARRLFDVFLAAGGLTPRSGNTVAISHKGNSGQPQVLTLSSDPVQSAQNNVDLQPGDTVVVSRAGVVYVVGEVVRPGGFVIENGSSISIMQAMAMAAGPNRMAGNRAMVVRRTPDGKIQNTPIDIKKIVEAKATDIALQADDILFVPASKGRLAMERGTNSVFSMLANLAIYRF